MKVVQPAGPRAPAAMWGDRLSCGAALTPGITETTPGSAAGEAAWVPLQWEGNKALEVSVLGPHCKGLVPPCTMKQASARAGRAT